VLGDTQKLIDRRFAKMKFSKTLLVRFIARFCDKEANDLKIYDV
jgi:hypothetical protein